MSLRSTLHHTRFPPAGAGVRHASALEGKALVDYSTNPNTIKARRRRMNLSGIKKVEDAARTADYKAMMYARKVCVAKPEYVAASTVDKAAMLERTMHETMEKRRAKGQDTKSKIHAYQAGDPRALRAGNTGSSTRISMAHFLETEGLIPARGAAGAAATAQALPTKPLEPAPGRALTSTATSMQVGGHSRMPTLDRSSSNIFISLPDGDGDGDGDHSIKSSGTPAPLAHTTPEPMESIEGNDKDELTHLRNEVTGLRNMMLNRFSHSNNGNGRDYDLQMVRAEVGADRQRVDGLGQRLVHLEEVVHAIQNVSIPPPIVQRVAVLEGLMAEVKAKVGSGCDAEVARMREIFGSLRETLNSVGGII